MNKKHAILGISCYYHDSAAALILDGKVVAAAAEERFTRKKHDNGFPFFAIQFCLDSVGIAINELETVIFYEKPLLKFDRVLNQHLQHFPKSYTSFVDTTQDTGKPGTRHLSPEGNQYFGNLLFQNFSR